MTKSLVIVESPAKARTITKYLGSEFIVESSVGHIRDLPKKLQRLEQDHLYQKMQVPKRRPG